MHRGETPTPTSGPGERWGRLRPAAGLALSQRGALSGDCPGSSPGCVISGQILNSLRFHFSSPDREYSRLPPGGAVRVNRAACAEPRLVRGAERLRPPGVVTERVLVSAFWLSGESLQERSRVPVPSSPQSHLVF